MLLGQTRRERRIATQTFASLVVLCQLLAGCATPTTVLPEPVGVQDQLLRPGNVLRIQVWRQLEYSGEFVLGVDGRLVHPLYQEVPLEGLSVSEARAAIEQFLAGYLQDAQMVVEPLYRVSVAGEVRQPAVYQVERGTTVAEAVALAGGPTVLARLDEVTLVRSNELYTLRLGEDVVTFGQLPVLSGDQILLERQSTFSVWRDVVGPVSTIAALVFTSLRISELTGR
jgi:polysaccharide export outer membrane protein